MQKTCSMHPFAPDDFENRLARAQIDVPDGAQHTSGVLGAFGATWSLDILESERERKHEVTSPVCRFVRKVMATLKRESEHAGGVLRI